VAAASTIDTPTDRHFSEGARVLTVGGETVS
jgi:hypothetical protein